ncbi:hypothetical protein CVS40_10941 [Lucilia cuprina]|nr:hypothetical protein CVS40_10941 [Lucilia cuprina]
MIRDTIISYTPHETVRTAALQKQNPTLGEVVSLAETYESAQKSLSTLKGNSTKINLIKHYKNNQEKNNTTTTDLIKSSRSFLLYDRFEFVSFVNKPNSKNPTQF